MLPQPLARGSDRRVGMLPLIRLSVSRLASAGTVTIRVTTPTAAAAVATTAVLDARTCSRDRTIRPDRMRL